MAASFQTESGPAGCVKTILMHPSQVEMLATQHAQERMVAGDSQGKIRFSVQNPEPQAVDTADSAVGGCSRRLQTESRGHIRMSTHHNTYLDDHDTAKVALAICHRNEDKTEDVGEGEDARTEEAAMIKAAARWEHLIQSQEPNNFRSNFRLGFYVDQRTSKEIRLKKELRGGKLEKRHFEILEMIPFSPEDNMTGMFVQETGEGIAAVNRLFLKGTKEAFEFLENPVPDFTARGLKTVFFAEAKLSNAKWEELREFVDDINYRRDKNSEKVRRQS